MVCFKVIRSGTGIPKITNRNWLKKLSKNQWNKKYIKYSNCNKKYIFMYIVHQCKAKPLDQICNIAYLYVA